MPGRNPKEAFNAFLKPIQGTLGCLTWERLQMDENPHELGVPKALRLPSVELSGELKDGSSPAFFAGIEYRVIEDKDASSARTRFKVSTERYTYHLTTTLGEEFLLYHWHPESDWPLPHLHVGKQQLSTNSSLDAGSHIPTARMALETLVLFIIEELGVPPIYPNYREIIGPHLKNFVDNRSWT